MIIREILRFESNSLVDVIDSLCILNLELDDEEYNIQPILYELCNMYNLPFLALNLI